jgi:hypothetical protein
MPQALLIFLGQARPAQLCDSFTNLAFVGSKFGFNVFLSAGKCAHALQAFALKVTKLCLGHIFWPAEAWALPFHD